MVEAGVKYSGIKDLECDSGEIVTLTNDLEEVLKNAWEYMLGVAPPPPT